MRFIMFKLRLLTAVILVPLVLGGLYFATPPVFWIVLAFLGLGCGIEWLQLIPVKQRVLQVSFITLLLIAICGAHYIYSFWLFIGLILWCWLAYCIIKFPKSESIWGKPWVVAILGLTLIPLFVESMFVLFLREHGRYFVAYLLAFVWVADSGAYIAGKLWGNRKLITAVSPGKTIEGLMGGLILSLIVGLFGYSIFKPHLAVLWYFFILLLFFVAVAGDLLVSMLKRRVRLKDSGHFFPGHGGILDRMDSLMAASPFFCWGLSWFSS